MGTDDGIRHDVVVGVDGSGHALHAVGWAATEAHLRALPLRMVHAVSHPVDPGAREPRSAPEILARAFTVARRAAPGVVVSTTRTTQDPAASLLDAAAGAAVLVVGMGGDTSGEPLVGSVALDVSGRAPCPVVVVRGGPVPPQGPVLVGVDTFGEDGVSVVHGNPAQALLRAAAGSRLVVLGTRGHGAYTRDLLGSTSREVLRRSPVPVLVVNPDTVGPAPDPDERPAAEPRSTQLDHPHDHSVLF